MNQQVDLVVDEWIGLWIDGWIGWLTSTDWLMKGLLMDD